MIDDFFDSSNNMIALTSLEIIGVTAVVGTCLYYRCYNLIDFNSGYNRFGEAMLQNPYNTCFMR